MTIRKNSMLLPKHTNYSLLWTLILYFALNSVAAQTASLDALKEQLPSAETPQKRFKILDDIAWFSRLNYPDQTIQHAQLILDLAREQDNSEWLAVGYNRLGVAETTKGNLYKAISFYDSALRIETRIENDFGIGRASHQLARIFVDLNDFSKARQFAFDAVTYFEKAESWRALADAKNVLGYIYTDLVEYDSSLHYLSESLELNKELKLGIEIGRNQLNLSRLYLRMHNFERCLFFGNQAIATLDSLGRGKAISAKAYTNIGEAYYKLWQLDKAEASQLRSLEIKESLNEVEETAINLNNLGNIYGARGQLDKAESYHLRSMKVRTDYRMPDLFLSHFNLGLLYLKKEKAGTALNYLTNAYTAADSLGKLKIFPEILIGLSDAHFQLGQHSKAYEFRTMYSVLSDEISRDLTRTNNLALSLQQQRSDADLLRAENVQQQLASDKQKITIYSLFGGIVLLLLLFFAIYRLSQLRNKHLLGQKNEKIQQQRIEQLIKEKEVDAMNAMVEGQESERLRIARDLHDRLGATLSIVKMHFKSVEESIEVLKETNIQQYKEANDLLDEACDEVRKIAHDMVSGVLMKFGLVAALEDLKSTVENTGQLKINLIDIGLEARLNYDYEINIYRIIQELLTNTLKHAKASEMNVQLFRKDKRLSIVVDDNGIGFDPAMISEVKGMGLRNIEGRVEKLDGEVIVDSGLGAGTTVTIDLPLKQDSP